MIQVATLAYRMHQAFMAHLGTFDVQELERESGAVYGVLPDEGLGYYNPAWVRFAEANGAPDLMANWPLGRPVGEAIAEPLLAFYRSKWAEVRATGQPWTFPYECSSPEQHRQFHMIVLPLAEGALAVVNRLVVEQPYELAGRKAERPDDSRYRDSQGIIRQCSYCRCTRRVCEADVWDWVPAYLDRTLEGVSHGICGVCAEQYFPRTL